MNQALLAYERLVLSLAVADLAQDRDMLRARVAQLEQRAREVEHERIETAWRGAALLRAGLQALRQNHRPWWLAALLLGCASSVPTPEPPPLPETVEIMDGLDRLEAAMLRPVVAVRRHRR